MNEGMSQMLQMMFQPYFAPITIALIHFSGTRIISTHITTIQSHINTLRALFQLADAQYYTVDPIHGARTTSTPINTSRATFQLADAPKCHDDPQQITLANRSNLQLFRERALPKITLRWFLTPTPTPTSGDSTRRSGGRRRGFRDWRRRTGGGS